MVLRFVLENFDLPDFTRSEKIFGFRFCHLLKLKKIVAAEFFLSGLLKFSHK